MQLRWRGRPCRLWFRWRGRPLMEPFIPWTGAPVPGTIYAVMYGRGRAFLALVTPDCGAHLSCLAPPLPCLAPPPSRLAPPQAPAKYNAGVMPEQCPSHGNRRNRRNPFGHRHGNRKPEKPKNRKNPFGPWPGNRKNRKTEKNRFWNRRNRENPVSLKQKKPVSETGKPKKSHPFGPKRVDRVYFKSRVEAP